MMMILSRAVAASLAARVLLFTFAFLPALAPQARADWPEFRGPRGDGTANLPGDKPLGVPLRFSENANIRWKIETPNLGWSTPVVMEGRVWMTHATKDGRDFFAFCVDAESGKILVNEKVFHSDNPEPLGNQVNGYASPSPAIEKGRVYVHFGSYGTACLDSATGKPVWKRQDLPCRHFRGPGSSVILWENLLILTMDGIDQQYLAALDKQTGATVWKTPRTTAWNDLDASGKPNRDGDFRKAFSTPILVTAGGQTVIVSVGSKAAYGYDPRTGKELWKFRMPADYSTAARPVAGRGLVFVMSGQSKPEMFAIRLGGQGDVTETHLAWRSGLTKTKTPSPLLVGDLVYLLGDDGTLLCRDAATGKEVWKDRVPGNYAASPLFADGRIYCCSQQGKVTVVEAGRTCKVLAVNELGDGFMASPAVDGKALILRTKTHLYRVELAEK